MNTDTPQNVIARFAPSPTGYLHVGGARTMLFNYLFAKQHGGKTLLRIEDTDKERSTKAYEQNILEGLAWLGIPFDGEPVRQSERTEIYKKYLRQMIDSGAAYISKEEPKEEGDRAEVIRFKNPNKKVTFTDLIRGEITFDTTELKDFVIAKSLEEPLYHLAVIIDDFEMNITHVIRGEDHISNTPRQILLQEAIGAPRPVYAHLPLILATDRSKLSKRKHGESVSLPYYKDHGYLPEAMINFLALLGWNPGTEQEIFSLEELVKTFDISKVQKSGAVFNVEKLNWLNKEYIKNLPKDFLSKKIAEIFANVAGETLTKIEPLILDRVTTLGDIETIKTSGELSFFFEKPSYEQSLLKTPEFLAQTNEKIAAIPENSFTADDIKNALWDFATEQGRGKVLWPLRIALTGREKSPDPFTVAAILGKKETIDRITHAMEL
jgi:glutamyl-tRNA synthetase